MVWCTYTSIKHPTCRCRLAALTCEYRMHRTMLQVAQFNDNRSMAQKDKTPRRVFNSRRGVCPGVA